MMWRDAKSLCTKDGAGLPVPLSDEENKFIADLNYHEDTWLDINDLETEGTFVDNDGNPITYSNWYANEPNDWGGEDIAHIWGRADIYPKWNDENEATYGSGYIKNVVCIFKIPEELVSLKVKAKCENPWGNVVISGEYNPVAVFNGRVIYQQPAADPNKMWWSLFFNPETNRWRFIYHPTKIIVGKTYLGLTTELESDTPGELSK